ncbi:MAG: sigma-70 family RNA polymerase sigma factor [Rhodospirillaceae bacterium]
MSIRPFFRRSTALDNPETSDDDLVRLAADGDGAAWSDLMDRHLAAVVSFAWYRLHDRTEAEDVAQETMLRFSKKVGDWQPGGPQVRSWLYRVAGNLCIDRQRARRPETRIEDAEEFAVIDIRPHLDGKLDARRAVYKALGALPERQQVVLIMVYYQGHTVREAAAILSLSEHATESLLARARRTMRAALEPNREDLLGARSR